MSLCKSLNHNVHNVNNHHQTHIVNPLQVNSDELIHFIESTHKPTSDLNINNTNNNTQHNNTMLHNIQDEDNDDIMDNKDDDDVISDFPKIVKSGINPDSFITCSGPKPQPPAQQHLVHKSDTTNNQNFKPSLPQTHTFPDNDNNDNNPNTNTNTHNLSLFQINAKLQKALNIVDMDPSDKSQHQLANIVIQKRNKIYDIYQKNHKRNQTNDITRRVLFIFQI